MLSHTESTSTSPNQPIYDWFPNAPLREPSNGFFFLYLQSSPGGATGKEPACQCRRYERCGFNSWVGKIPWRRAWQAPPEFLPGKFHGQKSLVGHSLGGDHKKLDMSDHTHVHAADMGEVLKTRASTLTGAQSLFSWHLMHPHLSSGKSHSKAKQLVFSSRWIHLNQPELQQIGWGYSHRGIHHLNVYWTHSRFSRLTKCCAVIWNNFFTGRKQVYLQYGLNAVNTKKKKKAEDFPGGSVVKIFQEGRWIQSLVRGLDPTCLN